MTPEQKNAACIFTAICLLSAVIAWLGGYDFDHRGCDVAVYSAMTLFVAALTSFGALI